MASLAGMGMGNMAQSAPAPRGTDTPMGNGTSDCLNGRPLASVYAPAQDWRELYDAETALKRGTLFHELEFPFLGGGDNA